MAELTNGAVERLLLLLADYGRATTRAMLAVSPDPELTAPASVVVLCTLDLDGPRRPGALQELTGLSSGGVSKLLDRMEAAGVVKRSARGVAGDNRGVLVSITRRGRTLAGRFATAVAGQLPAPRLMVKEFAAVVGS